MASMSQVGDIIEPLAPEDDLLEEIRG